MVIGIVLGGGAFLGLVAAYALWLYFEEKKVHKGSNIRGPLN